MELKELIDFRNQLNEYGFEHFIFGGWGLDIINGERTRQHLDVDIVIWKDDRERFLKFLERQRCRIWDEGIKIVFGNEFVNGEVMFLREDGGDCVFEGQYFIAKMPANILIPFSKSTIGSQEFNIGSKELIVKMMNNWSRYPSDQKLARQLSKACDKKIMDKIELNRK
jgi:hypothetical protein